jgi:hypothetical protein
MLNTMYTLKACMLLIYFQITYVFLPPFRIFIRRETSSWLTAICLLQIKFEAAKLRESMCRVHFLRLARHSAGTLPQLPPFVRILDPPAAARRMRYLLPLRDYAVRIQRQFGSRHAQHHTSHVIQVENALED